MKLTKTIRKKIQSALPVIILVSSQAWAESQPDRRFTGEVSGLGSDSCASFILALNENRPTGAIRTDNKLYFTESAAYSQWLLGFINALNWVGSTTKGAVNSAGQIISFTNIPIEINSVALSVKKICEAKPDTPLAIAVMQYANTFVKK